METPDSGNRLRDLFDLHSGLYTAFQRRADEFHRVLLSTRPHKLEDIAGHRRGPAV
ncbi:unnamed protein product, partial [Heterotrigona itama]